MNRATNLSTHMAPASFLWERIIDGANIPKERTQLWLDACIPGALEDSELVAVAPNAFVRDYIVENFLDDLSEAARRVGIARGVRLEVQAPELQEDANQKREPQPDAQRGRPSLSNPSCTFENFVVGKSNRLAQAASLAVAEMPGKAYNPLFIWSGVGLGKTHLMQAIMHHALERWPRLKVLYLTAERFVNEFVQALADERSAQFRERFRSADILLIDDIQFLAGKRGSQEEFFHTFNALYEGGKQLVISSSQRPSNFRGFFEDILLQRFFSGLVVDIQPPDEILRVEILKKKAELLERDLPEDVINFLLSF